MKHHCNGCPNWYVTKKKYPSGFYNITICRKYNKQLYYLAGEYNRTPYPCDICSKELSYVPYVEFGGNEVQVMKYPSIKKYMTDHNLSLREFARQCDMPSSTMCRLLNGQTEPSKSTIDKILTVTGLSYEQCFREEKDE